MYRLNAWLICLRKLWFHLISELTDYHGNNDYHNCWYCYWCWWWILFTISVRTCSPLKAPKFGSIHPSPCKSLPTSGTTCHFECNHGFLADGGVKTALCGIDGNWNINETSILECRGKPYSLVFSARQSWTKREYTYAFYWLYLISISSISCA